MNKRIPLTERIKQLLEETFAACHPGTRVLVARGRWGGVHIVIISEAFQGRDLAGNPGGEAGFPGF